VEALAPSSDTTACSLFGPRCAYRLVIVKLLCPNKSAISSSGAPFIRSRLADVCRKSCQRKFLIPALSLRRRTNAARFKAVRRSWPTGTHALSRRPGRAQPSGAATAASFNGTCMGSSFFVRGMFNIRPLSLPCPMSGCADCPSAHPY